MIASHTWLGMWLFQLSMQEFKLIYVSDKLFIGDTLFYLLDLFVSHNNCEHNTRDIFVLSCITLSAENCHNDWFECFLETMMK